MSLAPANRARLQSTVAAIGACVLWWRIGAYWTVAIACVAGVLALLAWISPSGYAPVQRGLDRVMHLFLTALTWLLLLIVFLGLIVPLRIWRLFTRSDPLALRRSVGASTYLQPLAPRNPRHFERQF